MLVVRSTSLLSYTEALLILQQAERSTLGIQLTLPDQHNMPRGYRAGLIRELTPGGPAFLSEQVKVKIKSLFNSVRWFFHVLSLCIYASCFALKVKRNGGGGAHRGVMAYILYLNRLATKSLQWTASTCVMLKLSQLLFVEVMTLAPSVWSHCCATRSASVCTSRIDR